MGNLIGLIIFVADVVMIMDCWKSNKDQGKKILWTLIILLLPLIGLIAYYFVGKKQ